MVSCSANYSNYKANHSYNNKRAASALNGSAMEADLGMETEDWFEHGYQSRRHTKTAYSGTRSMRNKRELRMVRRLRTVVLVMAILIATLLIGIFSFARKADAVSVPMYKYYTSVEVDQGDSLWSIAEDHMSPGYKNCGDLVDEIYSINGLHSDALRVGQKVIVPYYSTEYQK